MDGLRFVVAALAAWRLAHLLAYEDGPFALVARLRAVAGRFGGVLDCFQCLSLWAAAPLALWVTTASFLGWACVALGLSGAACLLERLAAPPVVMQPLPPALDTPGSMEEEQTGRKESPHGMLRTDAGGGGSRRDGTGDLPGPGDEDGVGAGGGSSGTSDASSGSSSGGGVSSGADIAAGPVARHERQRAHAP